MDIRCSPKQSELESFFTAKDPAAAEVLSRLSADGDLDLSLCLMAEDAGRPVGALVIVPARSGDVPCAFAACTAYNEEHTLAQLWLHAFSILKERGIAFVFTRFTDAEKAVYYDRFKWEWIVCLGFVPPVLDESALNYGGKRLDEKASPSCRPLPLPKALGIPEPEALFYGENIVSEEELAKQIYTARERRRWGERAALIVFIIAVCAVEVTRTNLTRFLSILPILGIGMYLLFLNIYRPKKVTADVLAKRKAKGLNGTDDRYFFGEEHFICFDRGRGSSIVPYDNIIAVYDKPDFLFLCTRSGTKDARGWFVSASSLADKQVFLDHIRKKSPNVSFRK